MTLGDLAVPRIKLTRSAIDALSASHADVVYWDTGCPGFGLKVTPKGRKVFIFANTSRIGAPRGNCPACCDAIPASLGPTAAFTKSPSATSERRMDACRF